MFPMFLPLLEHMHRWRRCIIIGKAIEAINFTSFSRNGSKAFFDEMHITIQGIPELQDTNIPHLPTFYSDSPHGVSMRISVLSLPDPALMSSFHLCHLRIEECSPGVIPNPLRMLQFLAFCPQLWTFRYHGYPHEPGEEWKTNERPSIVNLEKLRVLGIKGTCAVRTVLSHIHAPSLVELHLEHTNMEFEPSSVARYPYGVEDGDSDDEAQDFSQSPWSDHATGMGLRSLLRRSRPRLEILVMDYADMRTKDFVWCFDRLPALEKFRIVASDMSDKVIGMFAPYEEGVKVKERWPIGDIRDRWDGTPGMGIEGIEVGMKVVRMPKLRMLELWNCQRLSGDAMVHALQARIRLTDRVADGNLLMKMEDVAIVGCADFMPRHAIDLALDLGPRLRI